MTSILPFIYLAAILLALMMLSWIIPALPLYRIRFLLDEGTARVVKSLPPALEGSYHGRAVRLTNDPGTRRDAGKFAIDLECRNPHPIIVKRKPRVIRLTLGSLRSLGKPSPPDRQDLPLYEIEGPRDDWALSWLARPDVSDRVATLMNHHGVKSIQQMGGALCVTRPVVFTSWANADNAKVILAEVLALAQSLESMN